MMIRTLLLLTIALALMPVGTNARGNVWRQKQVKVYDYAGKEWQVEQVVIHFNQVLPKRAPSLIYVPAQGVCEIHPQAITVCPVPSEEIAPAVGRTWLNFGARKARFALVRFAQEERPAGMRLACHEINHALGAIAEGDWARTDPALVTCPYAAQELHRIYKQERRDRKHR